MGRSGPRTWPNPSPERGHPGQGFPPPDRSKTQGLIAPNKSIFGIKIGTSEEEVFRKLGKPRAYYALSNRTGAAVYDETLAFLFTHEALSGIHLGSSLIDHRLLENLGQQTDSPSIIPGDSRTESLKIIPWPRLRKFLETN